MCEDDKWDEQKKREKKESKNSGITAVFAPPFSEVSFHIRGGAEKNNYTSGRPVLRNATLVSGLSVLFFPTLISLYCIPGRI